MLFERDINCCHWSAHCLQDLVILVVADNVCAVLETTQLQLALPLRGIERVIQYAGFTNRVRLRPVESDVIQSTKILALGKHIRLINRDPLPPDLLLFRSQVQVGSASRSGRPGKLCSNDASNSDRGCKV